MDEHVGEDPNERTAHRPEGALGELVQILLENPWTHQALKVALEARDRASHASAQVMQGVGVPSVSDLERVERRLRSVSERLEDVEDQLDSLARQLSELRKASTPPRA